MLNLHITSHYPHPKAFLLFFFWNNNNNNLNSHEVLIFFVFWFSIETNTHRIIRSNFARIACETIVSISSIVMFFFYCKYMRIMCAKQYFTAMKIIMLKILKREIIELLFSYFGLCLRYCLHITFESICEWLGIEKRKFLLWLSKAATNSKKKNKNSTQ